ncbi:MAG: VWA domain-containing protein [Acidobacteriota bacterium]|nr:VWA domain-containing protein [Acidobacteriota bacterium]
MRSRCETGGLTIVALLLCAQARAQDPASSKSPDETIFRSDTRLVELHATVTDKAGALLTDLPQSAFQLFENDTPQEIKVFRREDVPVSLGLIVDNSASMGDKRDKVASAALALVRASNPNDEVFIMKFSDRPSLARDFTRNIQELESGLKKIDPSGTTAMRDALMIGIEHLKHGAVNDKKVLLVVTDGNDNSSFETLDHLLQSARQSGILIYGIGLLSAEEPREAARAKKALDTLTVATGGEVFYPKDLAEVDEIAHHVAHDLRNQYILAYNPSDQRQDGSFRRIRVTVREPAGAIVKTRSGYYAGAPAR